MHVYSFTCGPGSVLDTGDTMSCSKLFSPGFIFKLSVLDKTLLPANCSSSKIAHVLYSHCSLVFTVFKESEKHPVTNHKYF